MVLVFLSLVPREFLGREHRMKQCPVPDGQVGGQEWDEECEAITRTWARHMSLLAGLSFDPPSCQQQKSQSAHRHSRYVYAKQGSRMCSARNEKLAGPNVGSAGWPAVTQFPSELYSCVFKQAGDNPLRKTATAPTHFFAKHAFPEELFIFFMVSVFKKILPTHKIA